MKKRIGSQLLAILIFGSMLGIAKAQNATHDWDFIKFSEVRAYRYNWDKEISDDRIIVGNMKLNETRIPKGGVSLNQKQVSRLKDALTGSHPKHDVAMCFEPHHAFVFFDSAGKIVGYFDICFHCSNYYGTPKGFAKPCDLTAVYSIFNDLDIPITNPKWK